MAERMTDKQLEELLRKGIPLLYEADEAEFGGAEEVPVPPELRERVLAKARQVTGMLAAAEARADGVEINTFLPTPGADAEHYYMTPEELRDFTQSR